MKHRLKNKVFGKFALVRVDRQNQTPLRISCKQKFCPFHTSWVLSTGKTSIAYTLLRLFTTHRAYSPTDMYKTCGNLWISSRYPAPAVQFTSLELQQNWDGMNIFFPNKKTFECPNRHLARFHKNVLLFVGNPFYKPNMHLRAPACSMFNSWWFEQNSKESIYSVFSPLCSMDSIHSFGGIMVGHFGSHFACKWHRVVAACPAKKDIHLQLVRRIFNESAQFL